MKREEVIEIAKKHHVNSEHTEFGWQECDRYELDIEELTAFIAEIERRTLERAANVCEQEIVSADETGEAEDYAYNNACNHCAAFIRVLGEK